MWNIPYICKALMHILSRTFLWTQISKMLNIYLLNSLFL